MFLGSFLCTSVVLDVEAQVKNLRSLHQVFEITAFQIPQSSVLSHSGAPTV